MVSGAYAEGIFESYEDVDDFGCRLRGGDQMGHVRGGSAGGS
jgi:hypothetical protein